MKKNGIKLTIIVLCIVRMQATFCNDGNNISVVYIHCLISNLVRCQTAVHSTSSHQTVIHFAFETQQVTNSTENRQIMARYPD